MWPVTLIALALVAGFMFEKRAKGETLLPILPNVPSPKPKRLGAQTPPPRPKAKVDTNRPPPRPTKVSGESLTVPSAIRSVSDSEWTEFCRQMATGEPHGIDPHYRLGVFRTSMRRLADLGLAVNLRRGTYGPDGKTVWLGDFKAPMSIDKFLANLKAQYRVFAKDMETHARYIDKFYRDIIGKVEIDGAPVTMSGLLAVAKHAGDKGIASWLSSDEIRHQFPGTTSAFRRFNGQF